MAKALEFKVYDYKMVRGDGGHSGRYGGAIFPESAKWIFSKQSRKKLQAKKAEPAIPEYEFTADSKRQEDVPFGKVTKHILESRIFEGTRREYHVYVPAQYDASKPSSVMIFQDGHAYMKEDGNVGAPIVFDNLIHKGEMPVTIGIFVNPGHKGCLLYTSPSPRD